MLRETLLGPDIEEKRTRMDTRPLDMCKREVRINRNGVVQERLTLR